MADIQPGYTYGDAPNNVINAANLNQHVANAVILPEFVSAKTLKDPAAFSDELLINDAGVLKKITLQQLRALLEVPPGTIMDYAGDVAPTGWLLCYGQAVLRASYARLFAIIGTNFGAGDGSTTFNIPDFRGRVGAGKDNMGGTSANRMSGSYGPNGDILGAVGGTESHTLNDNQMPSHTHFMTNMVTFTGAAGIAAGTGYVFSPAESTFAGSDFPHPNVQPTIIVNKIIHE